MSFDISTIKVAETFDIVIISPSTGEPIVNDDKKALSITVQSPASKQFKTAQAANNAKMVKRIKSKGNVDETPEEMAATTASFLAAITVSLNGFDYQGQSEGVETFRSLYADPKMGWLTEQVNRESGDWANFTQA